MRIVYYSKPCYADCDFPLIRQYQAMGHEVCYIMDLSPFSLRSTLIDIEKQPAASGIIPAEECAEFKMYGDYLDLKSVYIVNRTHNSVWNWENIKSDYRRYRFIRRFNPDVIHCTSPLDCFECILYLMRRKMILTVHDPFVHSGEEGFRKNIFRTLAFRLFPKFALLNSAQKDRFKEVHRIDEKRILVNRLGPYDIIRHFKPEKPAGRGKSILFFGRISPYKGLEYLLEAMKLVHTQVPDAELIIAGGGEIYFDYDSRQEGYVTLLNRYIGVPELARLIESCAFVVCPYTDATQSGVVMTSYSMGKPVVASNVGGLCEMVEDGKTGILVPEKDVHALARAIIALLEDECRLAQMRVYIEREYYAGSRSWKHVAEAFIGFYNV